MKTYEYEGFDKDKQPDKGTVEASTGEEAIMYLLQSGIYPISLVELSAGQARSNVKLNNLRKFREQLKAPPPRPINDLAVPKPKPKSSVRLMVILACAVVTIYFAVKLFIELGLLPGGHITP